MKRLPIGIPLIWEFYYKKIDGVRVDFGSYRCKSPRATNMYKSLRFVVNHDNEIRSWGYCLADKQPMT